MLVTSPRHGSIITQPERSAEHLPRIPTFIVQVIPIDLQVLIVRVLPMTITAA